MPVNGQDVKFNYYTRAKFNALSSKDNNAFYVVEESNGTKLLYLGSNLIKTIIDVADIPTGTGANQVAVGNHNHDGTYLKSYTETDPTVPAHVKSITSTNVSNWNSAYSWGNHASAGYVKSSGVTSVALASGTNNGTLKLTVNGTATDNISVKGLGSAAYKAETAFRSSTWTPTWSQVTDKSIITVSGTTDGTDTNPKAVSESMLKQAILALSPAGSRPSSDVSSWAKTGNSDTIPTSKLPSLAITDTFEVATQSAMTTLTAQKGDIAIRTDLNKTFILAAEPASTVGNWKELRTPTDAVLSVAGLTGAITSSNLKNSLSLNNVENKSSATIRSEITSANVTSALGFTPYNSTNPNGYQKNSDITRAEIEAKLFDSTGNLDMGGLNVEEVGRIVWEQGGTIGNMDGNDFTIYQDGQFVYIFGSTGLNMNGKSITNIGSLSGTYLTIEDGQIDFYTDVNMGGNQITGLIDPSISSDAATKNYVDKQFNNFTTITTNKTATAANWNIADINKTFSVNSTSARTITIPSDSIINYPIGTEIHFIRYNTGAVNITSGTGVFLNSADNKRTIRARYGAATIKKLGANTWILIGDLD